MSAEHLIGSQLSLISKAGARYLGYLFQVDLENQTVALRDVQAFGTEDRDVPVFVQPSETVFPYVVFKSTDIADIEVVKHAPAVYQDPAIVSVSDAPPPDTHVGFLANVGLRSQVEAHKPHSSAPREPRRQPAPKPHKQPAPRPASKFQPGIGGHLLEARERGTQADWKEPDTKEEFDIQESLSKFDKEAEREKVEEGEEKRKCYDKSKGFFDSISCQSMDQLCNNSGRQSFQEQRECVWM